MKFATSPSGDTARVSAKDHTTRQKTDIKKMRFLTNILGTRKKKFCEQLRNQPSTLLTLTQTRIPFLQHLKTYTKITLLTLM